MSLISLVIQILLVLVSPIVSAMSYKYFAKKGVAVIIVMGLIINGLLYLYT